MHLLGALYLLVSMPFGVRLGLDAYRESCMMLAVWSSSLFTIIVILRIQPLVTGLASFR